VFTSPVAGQLIPQSNGVIPGKSALRNYWRERFRRIPDPHIEVISVYIDVDTLVIRDRNQDNGLGDAANALVIGVDDSVGAVERGRRVAHLWRSVRNVHPSHVMLPPTARSTSLR
jgi:hypothetical protein